MVDDIVDVVAGAAPEIREGLPGRRVYESEENPSGEAQLAADVYADELLEERLLDLDSVATYASEERESVVEGDGGIYHVACDPLDGSSNLESNNPMGTVFAVYDRPLPAAGDAVAAAFEREGHAVRRREVVPDEFETVREAVEEAVADGSIDVVVTTGGTGVTPDDVTVEAVAILFDKELPGFGELFRSLSREEVGTRIVGTRAIAGIVRRPDGGDGVPVFCLPGSENAARLGTEEIVVAEAPHLAGLARR